MPWATYEQTGAVSGLAYQPTSNTLFTSAFFKANSLYGPQGAGGIYSINLDTGVVSNFLDVDSYFGADYTGSDIACDANGGSFDPFCFHEVGQQSLGDLDISSDFQTLYSVAIRTDELLAIPVGNPPTAPVAASISMPSPSRPNAPARASPTTCRWGWASRAPRSMSGRLAPRRVHRIWLNSAATSMRSTAAPLRRS